MRPLRIIANDFDLTLPTTIPVTPGINLLTDLLVQLRRVDPPLYSIAHDHVTDSLMTLMHTYHALEKLYLRLQVGIDGWRLPADPDWPSASPNLPSLDYMANILINSDNLQLFRDWLVSAGVDGLYTNWQIIDLVERLAYNHRDGYHRVYTRLTRQIGESLKKTTGLWGLIG